MRRRSILPIGLAAGLAAAFATTRAQPQAGAQTATFEAFGVAVAEVVLDNGFRMLVVSDHRVPRVAASLWYRFGALQEQNGLHGAAHFLEHAVHQGTTTIGVTDAAADRALQQQIYEAEQALLAERSAQRNVLRERNVFYDELEWPTTEKLEQLRQRLYQLEDEQAKHRIFWEEYNWYRRAGAIYPHTDPVPATTGNEHLDIEVDLPAERLELFFRLEADRMVNAVLRGWEAQRFTVLEQFLGRYNPPEGGRFSEAFYGVTGVAHQTWLDPAGHLRDFHYYDRASMLRMYDDYFVPNNATLVLVGALTKDDAIRLGTRYFGKIPRGNPPLGMDAEADPPPGGSVRLDWLEPIDPRVTVRHRIPGMGHPDRAVFDVLARLISGEDGVVGAHSAVAGATYSANASRSGLAWPLGSPTIFDISGRAPRDEDLPALEQAILAGIERLRRGEVDPARLALIKKELRLDWQLVRSDRRSLAAYLGRFTTANDPRTLQSVIEARAAVTVPDIQRVTERYLVPWNRVTGTTRRNPQPTGPGRYLTNPQPGMRPAAGGTR